MATRPKMAVIGGGPMGRAIGRILGKLSTPVSIWARRPELRERLRAELPGVEVPAELKAAVEGADLVMFAVPANELELAAKHYGEFATGDQIVLSATRGVGPGFVLPHELIRKQTCIRKIGVLGGPLHARELALGRQINLVVASRFPEVIESVRALIAGAPVALSSSRDVLGVEVAGAIANVASLAAGMSEGLELSDTARGVLLTHGLADAKRLGVALGADEVTFAGLAGVGELIPRNVTSMDRHLEVGRRLAKGETLPSALSAVEGHVEGVATAKAAVERATVLRLKLPLVAAVASVLDQQASPKEALEAVLHLGLELEGRGRARA
ncbi:MAG: NAD(P)-binding domain-containing protein [Deltaproteobacteria bacterium]|jgi:glycerol-3-phosphate dehydrogenase (NAD(P)+)|nr:NAD(P)-binding domain-containing protein [Deltaproteobacteria bacterium]